jgi:HD-GYP domain-containing protein (c-di-GMP phosphodiesterase class II)
MPSLFLKQQRNDIQIKLSEVISALSYALDLVEGQPQGHAVRSCLIGMRLGRDLGLSSFQRSSLFYALLMKDLGCSSNAAKMCMLFGADDRATKHDAKIADFTSLRQTALFALRHVAPKKLWMIKAMRLVGIAVSGKRAVKELVQIRCERGANIARQFGLSEETAKAIHSLDEHFDGCGHPAGALGQEIPLLARIMGLAQTAEVFFRQFGHQAMRDMARDRRGLWFDPQLVDLLLSIPADDQLWSKMQDPAAHLAEYEPEDRTLFADDQRLDNIAEGFAQVIDAKSPWTYRHSLGVSQVAVGIGQVLDLPRPDLRDLKRAALLHDVGKLGISNLILDKPGKLTAEEMNVVRRHPQFTYEIMKRVAGFSQLAEMAASHHERLDGKGYHRGLAGTQLSRHVRILCVADMYEALSAQRPYRRDLTSEQVTDILDRNCPAGICPEILAALRTFIATSGFIPFKLAA